MAVISRKTSSYKIKNWIVKINIIANCFIISVLTSFLYIRQKTNHVQGCVSIYDTKICKKRFLTWAPQTGSQSAATATSITRCNVCTNTAGSVRTIAHSDVTFFFIAFGNDFFPTYALAISITFGWIRWKISLGGETGPILIQGIWHPRFVSCKIPGQRSSVNWICRHYQSVLFINTTTEKNLMLVFKFRPMPCEWYDIFSLLWVGRGLSHFDLTEGRNVV